jgi:vacuolar-type H+-ATPase subunit E/Vma4
LPVLRPAAGEKLNRFRRSERADWGVFRKQRESMMAETIEAFVSRLQAEGVDAGKEAAARIQAEAQAQADRTIQEAQTRAAEIVAAAKRDAALLVSRGQSELGLAVRDTLRRLQETLSKAIMRVFEVRVSESLADSEFLKQVLRDVIVQYAQADSQGNGDISVNVSPEIGSRLTDWALHELRQSLDGSQMHVDLRSTLAGAGFEYRVSGGTVEVTVESAVELLSDILRPQLREVLKHASNGEVTGAEGAAR